MSHLTVHFPEEIGNVVIVAQIGECGNVRTVVMGVMCRAWLSVIFRR